MKTLEGMIGIVIALAMTWVVIVITNFFAWLREMDRRLPEWWKEYLDSFDKEQK